MLDVRTAVSEVALRRKSYRNLREVLGTDARRAWRGDIFQRLAARLSRGGQYAGRPTLPATLKAMPIVSTVDQVYDWLGVEGADQYRNEYLEVESRLKARYESGGTKDPGLWAIESHTAELLYCLMRARRPSTVVETGIANGHSSFVLLSALQRNAHGRLVSVDVSRNVGHLVTAELSERWQRLQLTVVPPALEDLRVLLAPFAPIDLFLHDGDHRFPGQMLDYQIAATLLADDGLLLSDDIDMTTAWITAAERGILPPRRLALIDHRKAFGLSAT